MCCSYTKFTTMKTLTTGFDCVLIPGASKVVTANGQPVMLPSNYCGTGGGLVTGVKGGAASVSICSECTLLPNK